MKACVDLTVPGITIDEAEKDAIRAAATAHLQKQGVSLRQSMRKGWEIGSMAGCLGATSDFFNCEDGWLVFRTAFGTVRITHNGDDIIKFESGEE